MVIDNVLGDTATRNAGHNDTLLDPQAVICQPGPLPAMPYVTYDVAHFVIEAKIIASFFGQPSFPVLTIPGPVGQTWTVFWTVSVTDLSTVTSLNIIIPPTSGLIIGDPVSTGNPARIQIPITNNVSSPTVLGYDIDLGIDLPSPSGGGQTAHVQYTTRGEDRNIDEDPTIAVIKDPLDPPVV